MKNSSSTMTEGPLLSGVVKYTIPIILTGILQLLFNAADMVVVGRFCGSITVAAIGATGSMINLIINLFTGLAIGVGVSAAHAYGSRDDTAIHRTVHTAIPAAVVSGLFLTVVGVVFAEPLLRLMGTPEDVLKLAVVYMKLYFVGMTFTLVYNFSAAILRAAGDSKSPLLFLTVAGVANVILNLVFVLGFDMSVAGVAIATSISQGISAVMVVIALMRRRDSCRLELRKVRFYKHQLLKIIRIGLPSGVRSSIFSLSTVLIQSAVNSFDSVAMISGSAAAANIESFVYACLYAFNQTSVNFIGQNLGAKKYRRILRVFFICMILVSIVGLVAGITAYVFGPTLLGLFLPDSPEAVSYGMIRLACISLPYFICGIMDVTTGSLTGMGASTVPMIISVLGVCGIRISWIYTVFERIHTPECLFISFPISWVITLALQLAAFLLVYQKHKRDDEAAGLVSDGE